MTRPAEPTLRRKPITCVARAAISLSESADRNSFELEFDLLMKDVKNHFLAEFAKRGKDLRKDWDD